MVNLNKQHFLCFGVLIFILCAALFLRVGTLRAQHSKCHPRHFFILGLLFDGDWEGTIEKNLNKSAF